MHATISKSGKKRRKQHLLVKKHPIFEKNAEEIQVMIDRLSGEMTMSQIMEAEEELQKINQAAKK